MTSERAPPRIGPRSLRGHAFWRQQKGIDEAAPLLARMLPLVPLALILLHIGPGGVLDVALFVFGLLRVTQGSGAPHHCGTSAKTVRIRCFAGEMGGLLS